MEISESMIVAHDLAKAFGGQKAVEKVDLDIRAGEIFGLVGPDGAGKTTTIRLLSGALRPDRGSVTVAGFSMSQAPERAREKIGYLSQRFSLYDDLTVDENLRFFAEVRGLPRAEWEARSREILDFVGLADFASRLAGRLSGGMRQKLSLATALVTRPQVLLLDEPTTGVDPMTRQDFWQLILRLVIEDRLAVLLSTPYMDEATRCTRVGFIRQGRIIVQDTPSALRQSLAGRVIELAGSPVDVILRAAQAVDGVQSIQRFGNTMHAIIQPGERHTILEAISLAVKERGGSLAAAKMVPPLLEDVFIALSEAVE